jgi:hypothetical protein
MRISSSTLLRAAAAITALAVVGSVPAVGQGWWPWSNPAPVPREPVYRPPGAPGPGGAPGAPPPPGFGQQANPGGRPAICLQLEQRLAQEVNKGTQGRDQLPRIEGDMRQLERQVQVGQDQLERNQCYEYFLFAKSLRRTRACVDLDGQVEAAKRRLADLAAQRQQLVSGNSRSYRDDIIRELAYNNCGSSYTQEARRSSNPFASLWQDEDGSGGSGAGNAFGSLPFATYRTLCVRLCDGYYFPVSFSTLPTYFDRDADLCQSKCAAPAELYYHQNPGEGVEQAVSYKSKQAYSSLKTAFRYRKEFVSGCSCKQAEYIPQGGTTPEKRAEAPSAKLPR